MLKQEHSDIKDPETHKKLKSLKINRTKVSELTKASKS